MDTAVVALSRECTYLDAYALLQRAARADARADVGADARADAQGDARGGPGDEIPVVESQASPLLIASPSPSPNPSPNPNPNPNPNANPSPNPNPNANANPNPKQASPLLIGAVRRAPLERLVACRLLGLGLGCSG